MSDKTKLPKEGVRRFVLNEYVSPHRSFWARTVRAFSDDVEVIVYPAEGSIVDKMAEALEEIIDDCEHSGMCADGMAAALADIERCARAILARYRETDNEPL